MLLTNSGPSISSVAADSASQFSRTVSRNLYSITRSLTHSPWRTCPALCSPIHRSNWRQHISWPLPWPNPCRFLFCQYPQVLQVHRPDIISKRPSEFCRWDYERKLCLQLYYMFIWEVESCTGREHVFNIFYFFFPFEHFSRLPCRLKNCHLWVFFVPVMQGDSSSSYTLYPLNDCDKKGLK